MNLLQCSIFYVVVSIVVFVLCCQVQVNVVIAHNSHVLLPGLSNSVFDKDYPDLGCSCLDLGLLRYAKSGSGFLSCIWLTKAIPDFHDTFVEILIQGH